MQNRIRVLLAMICVIVAACDNRLENNYFPLEKGLSWDYKRSQTIVGQAWPEVDEFSLRNLGREQINNAASSHAVFVRRTSDGTDYYLSDTAEGIRRVAKRTVVETKPRFDSDLRIVLPSKEKLKFGNIWNVESGPYVLHTRPGYSADLSDNRFKMAFEVIDLEATVDVPAGRFEGCLKIEGYASIRLFADARIGFVDVPITQTEWYAPGVGMVKLERDEPIDGVFYVGGKVTLELKNFDY